MKKNITIKDFMVSVGFKIDCGYEYLWDCFGQSSAGIGWTSSDNSDSAGIVYDTSSQLVYEITVWDTKASKVLRWIRPDFAKKYKSEARRRGVSHNVAYDKVKFSDASPAECLDKLKRIVRRKRRA